MELLLLRHGQTAGNLERRYVGRTDEPLSPAGRAAAAALGADDELGLVYVSPLARARETAGILFPNARQIALADLREMDFGEFEYRTADEMAHDAAYTRWVEGGCTAPCPGGEGLAGFTKRSCRGFAWAAGDAEARRLERLVVVAHGGTVMAVMSCFSRPARPYFDWAVGCCGGYRARLGAGLLLTDPERLSGG